MIAGMRDMLMTLVRVVLTFSHMLSRKHILRALQVLFLT